MSPFPGQHISAAHYSAISVLGRADPPRLKLDLSFLFYFFSVDQSRSPIRFSRALLRLSSLAPSSLSLRLLR